MSMALRIAGIILIVGGFLGGLIVSGETQTFIGITLMVSGIITGILFLSGAVVIDLLDRIVINQEENYRNWAQKAKASSTVCSPDASN